MSSPVSYSRSGPISRIVMDDGKANVMSLAMLNALHAAFDEAQRDKAVVTLSARGKHFSGGFDLNVFASGGADEQYQMVKAGAELALRILSFPTPVVAACHGNAFPMGAFLIMASDHRIAAEGDYRIGMNEVAIGLTPPRFAIELARQRLTPAYFNRTVVTGEMFGPAEAVVAGFFDRLVPAIDLERDAEDTAVELSNIHLNHHAAAKARARGEVIATIRRAIDADITPKYGKDRVAARTASARAAT
ncbi:crotonase/enoyl-CoA hydratase family protein [Bradyrhizobium sp. LHD-71]|uniref:crotonase/enoyl-CoA hydratase family protein n=1 Tax=Bradyrhizobium sp. LHD-71 TaxID=3072141 RepID=UPI00280DD478|nr:crotonase/enoyl-CoA hydratase family protein [Bradyrhizobium sp. LHD-71]MDQ8726814.1 crotonase/enoyl-CoA hydratase family protein [Bradyrhizobium sp. LHD-71]